MKQVMRDAGHALLLLAGLWIGMGQALACVYHGTIRGGFSGLYPGSISVASAIADAREKKLLPAARAQTPLSFRRALADLEGFRGALGNRATAAAQPERTDFSLVLISAGLWSHFNVDRANIWAKYHVKAPMPQKPVVITDEAVLRAISDKSMQMEQAIRLGLITVRNDKTGAVTALLLAASS